MCTESNESLSEKLRKSPDEYYILVRLLDLEPDAIMSIVTTAIAHIMMHTTARDDPEGFSKTMLGHISKKIIAATEDLANGTTEVCVICEKKFLSLREAGDVKICLPCLVNYVPKRKRRFSGETL
jgi:hypothetical protein